MNYWLVKSEPDAYSWDKFVKEGKTFWNGIRNYQARNNLKEMKKGDLVFFYHSNEGKDIVGIAKVTKEAYQDPTTDDPRWVVVDIAPDKPLKNSVTLETVKADPKLKKMQLVTHSRLSVQKVTETEFERIMELSK